VPWSELGDGSVFAPMPAEGEQPGDRDAERLRTEYGRAVGYSLTALLSYLARYGTDDTVLVFLGDHQPAATVTGEDASRDVPVTIVARDAAVLDRIASWGWTDGLRPRPDAPVWPMSAFRARFLSAFAGDEP
jgi:hypothetical protein